MRKRESLSTKQVLIALYCRFASLKIYNIDQRTLHFATFYFVRNLRGLNIAISGLGFHFVETGSFPYSREITDQDFNLRCEMVDKSDLSHFNIEVWEKTLPKTLLNEIRDAARNACIRVSEMKKDVA
jgi:hypothetical protein